MGNLPGGRWGLFGGSVKYKIEMKLTRVLCKRRCWQKWSNRQSSRGRWLWTGKDTRELINTRWDRDQRSRNGNLLWWLQKCLENVWDDDKLGLTPGANTSNKKNTGSCSGLPKEVVNEMLALVKKECKESRRQIWVGNRINETSSRMDLLIN